MNVTVEDVVYGEDAVIVVSADVDGSYIVNVNGTNVTVNVVNGKGNATLSLDIGIYSANVAFDDPNYDTILTHDVFNVLQKSDVNMVITYNAPIWYGDNLVLSAKLPNNVMGNVTVKVGNSSYVSAIIDGVASFSIPDVSSGDHIIEVIYEGNEHYNEKTVNVPVHIKNVTLQLLDAVYGWAKSIRYQAKLIDEDGNGISNKEVAFSINGKTIKAYTNSNGVAAVSLGLNIGAYDMMVSSYYGNFTRKITIVSRFSGNKNINMYYFDGSKYSFKVYGDNGKLVGANQVVVVKLNKKTYKLKTNKNGVISLKIPKTVKPGKYTITASYKGQTIKNTIKVKKILSSKKLVKVKKTAKKLILKAKLKKKLKGKKITFRFRGKKYTAKTNKKGIAKVKINKKVIKKLKRGKKYKVKITYFKTSIKTKVKVR